MEWTFSLFAIVGAIFVSIKRPVIGYILFLISSICGVIWSILNEHWVVMLQAIFFVVINCIGIFSWWNWRKT